MKLALAVPLLAAVLCGCSATLTPIHYSSNPPMADAPPSNLRVAVAPFEDLTPDNSTGRGPLINELNDGFGTGTTRFETWLAQDLRDSGLFASVHYSDWSQLVESHDRYDLIITGRLYRHEANPFLSNLGLYIEAGLAVTYEVEAIDPRKPDHPVWTKQFQRTNNFYVFNSAANSIIQLINAQPDFFRQSFADVRNEVARVLHPDGDIGKWLALRKEVAP